MRSKPAGKALSTEDVPPLRGSVRFCPAPRPYGLGSVMPRLRRWRLAVPAFFLEIRNQFSSPGGRAKFGKWGEEKKNPSAEIFGIRD